MTATAAPAKGGWAFAVDGGGSQTGGSPATSLAIQIVDPSGNPVTAEYQGKAATQATLTAPFQGTFLVRRPVPGTYTIRANSTAADPKAPPRSCEATVTVAPEKKVGFFVEGDVGKERRVRNEVFSDNVTRATGVCAPLVGFKLGPDIKLSPSWRFAPSGGVAINTKTGGNSSLFAEAEFDRFSEGQSAFFGTGIGVWDITHSDTVAPTWLLQFGKRVTGEPDRSGLYFVASGRLFLNKLDDTKNNYQFWGGFRYIFR